VWQVEDDGLSVLQGSNVVYIERLNEGHSQQAPAGFIDAGAEDARDMLIESMTDVAVNVMLGAVPSMIMTDGA
jgi:hypothetical protein